MSLFRLSQTSFHGRGSLATRDQGFDFGFVQPDRELIEVREVGGGREVLVGPVEGAGPHTSVQTADLTADFLHTTDSTADFWLELRFRQPNRMLG